MKRYRELLERRAAEVQPIEPPSPMDHIQRRNRENLARWRFNFTTGRVPPLPIIRKGEE